jgi:transcriptional regulator with XRE-family HTH domain
MEYCGGMGDGADGPKSEAERDRELAEVLQQVHDQELTATTAEELADRRQIYEYWEKDFGNKVRQWRQARNWSQEDLADRLREQGFDMHQTTVAKIERGTRPLRVAEAAAIATIFRVPPLAVFMGPPPEKLPWSMQQLHETLELAEQNLAAMKELMESSAKRYIEQQAHVFELSNVLNEAGLNAERRKKELTAEGQEASGGSEA